MTYEILLAFDFDHTIFRSQLNEGQDVQCSLQQKLLALDQFHHLFTI